MGDWGVLHGSRVTRETAANYGTTITAGSPAHVKGSWTQITSSTTHPAKGITLLLNDVDIFGYLNQYGYLVDFAYDGIVNPTYLAKDVAVNVGGASRYNGFNFYLPYTLPAGSDVRARVQSSQANATLEVAVYLHDFSWPNISSFQRSETYGAVSGSSTSTQLDPGGTAHTKGSWTQLTASTTSPIRWLVVNMGILNPAARIANWAVDVGIGGSGSEVVILPDLLMIANAAADDADPKIYHFPVTIPEGTRIAARCMSSTTDATDRLIRVQVIGVD